MSRLLSRPLAFFRSLMPRSSDRQPVKSGPCVNMTELNANAGEKQANLTQTEDSLQPLPLLPLLMHPAPSAKPQCPDARASAKQEKTHTLNAFITASINFNPNSDILNYVLENDLHVCPIRNFLPTFSNPVEVFFCVCVCFFLPNMIAKHLSLRHAHTPLHTHAPTRRPGASE